MNHRVPFYTYDTVKVISCAYKQKLKNKGKGGLDQPLVKVTILKYF